MSLRSPEFLVVLPSNSGGSKEAIPEVLNHPVEKRRRRPRRDAGGNGEIGFCSPEITVAVPPILVGKGRSKRSTEN